MKKQFVWIVSALLITIAACNGNKPAQQETVVTQVSEKSIKVDDILTIAETQIDKEIIVEGHVTHTCKHSGKRCFLVGDNESFSIRIEAGGEIKGFNRELVGNTIRVKGTLKERRLSEEYINQMEEEVKAKAVKEDGSAETCQAELSNISEMRQWMTDHGKNYYSIYFINGISYELVN